MTSIIEWSLISNFFSSLSRYNIDSSLVLVNCCQICFWDSSITTVYNLNQIIKLYDVIGSNQVDDLSINFFFYSLKKLSLYKYHSIC